jgi:hypothetical protein
VSYEFDIFFSYKRDIESNFWHKRLKEKVDFWTKYYLGVEDLRIFFDVDDIRTGELWRERIAEALRKSKCVVCIWSYTYFRSKHCVSEWETFEKRSISSGTSLIASARNVREQIMFPPKAQSRQSLDFSEYFSTFDSFWTSQRGEEFERNLLKRFADDVAKIIRNAPDYAESFPIIDVFQGPDPDGGTTARPRIDRIANA